jgi:hypothetical protein
MILVTVLALVITISHISNSGRSRNQAGNSLSRSLSRRPLDSRNAHRYVWEHRHHRVHLLTDVQATACRSQHNRNVLSYQPYRPLIIATRITIIEDLGAFVKH